MQQILDFPVAEVMTFDNFVTCDGNSAALQFARRITDESETENLLYLHGPSGSGKTHLLKAVEQAISPGLSKTYLSCCALSGADELLEHFNNAPFLLLDDLHQLPDDRQLRNALWQLFNDFNSAGRPVVMAGLMPPRELKYLDDHLVSRLLWGLVARVDASDDQSRRMILKKVADDLQVRVPDEVVSYILATTSREVGDLIKAFEMLYKTSLSTKRKITLPLAREAREIHTAGAEA
jgi:chromosomal replication initiator protein